MAILFMPSGTDKRLVKEEGDGFESRLCLSFKYDLKKYSYDEAGNAAEFATYKDGSKDMSVQYSYDEASNLVEDIEKKTVKFIIGKMEI